MKILAECRWHHNSAAGRSNPEHGVGLKPSRRRTKSLGIQWILHNIHVRSGKYWHLLLHDAWLKKIPKLAMLSLHRVTYSRCIGRKNTLDEACISGSYKRAHGCCQPCRRLTKADRARHGLLEACQRQRNTLQLPASYRSDAIQIPSEGPRSADKL